MSVADKVPVAEREAETVLVRLCSVFVTVLLGDGVLVSMAEDVALAASDAVSVCASDSVAVSM